MTEKTLLFLDVQMTKLKNDYLYYDPYGIYFTLRLFP